MKTTPQLNDTYKNKHGEVFKIENMRGVKMLIKRADNGIVAKATVLSKVDFTKLEKIEKGNEDV